VYFKNPSSFILVLLQLILMLALFSAGPVFPKNPLSFLLLSVALVLGIWSISTMFQKSKFNGPPEVAPESRLVTTGPYKYIRNPMYTAILIGGLGLFLNDFSLMRFFLLLLLLLLLLYKIRVEEYYLSQLFPHFKDYIAKTSRLIPGVY
jgi:protein-S-isoprenylcysteine O-methyltransferase Ste14